MQDLIAGVAQEGPDLMGDRLRDGRVVARQQGANLLVQRVIAYSEYGFVHDPG